MTNGAKIHGHAYYDFEGKPLAGATLTATNKAGDYMPTRADDQGAFTFTAMQPGDYTVTVQQFNSGTPWVPSVDRDLEQQPRRRQPEGRRRRARRRPPRNAAPKK